MANPVTQVFTGIFKENTLFNLVAKVNAARLVIAGTSVVFRNVFEYRRQADRVIEEEARAVEIEQDLSRLRARLDMPPMWARDP